MFYIRFTTEKLIQSRTEYIALPSGLKDQNQYYQIFENAKPLSGMWYQDLKSARKALRELPELIQATSNGWYKVERRGMKHAPVGRILGIRKTYDDGTIERVTYVIRTITIASKMF